MPYSSAKLAVPEPFRLALMLMLRCALSVSLLADQETALLTKMSPLPAVDGSVAMLTLVLPKLLDKVLAPIPEVVRPALPAAMVKSMGSINQVPVWPAGAAVLILAASATVTCAALVSMNPPLPPLGALASSVPATFTVPAAMPPSKVILPSWLTMVWASMSPVLFTMLASSVSLAPALSITMPPSALIKPPFSARLFKTLWSTTMLTKLLPLKFKVTALPPPKTTEPSCATIAPWLLTWLPSSAT